MSLDIPKELRNNPEVTAAPTPAPTAPPEETSPKPAGAASPSVFIKPKNNVQPDVTSTRSNAPNPSGTSNAPSSGSSVVPVPETENTDIDLSNLSEFEKYAIEHNLQNLSIDDIIKNLRVKSELTEQEQKLLDLYDSKVKIPKTSNPSTKDTELQEKVNDYKEILKGDGTTYQKTSKILDKYLLENDETYRNLPEYNGSDYSKDKRRQYRDNLIAQLRKDFAPGQLSSDERKYALTSISQLVISCVANNMSLNGLLNSPKGTIKSEINNIQNKGFEALTDSIDFSEGKSSEEILAQVADKLFANNKNYQSKSPEEKQKYAKQKLNDLIKNHLGINLDEKDLSDEQKRIINDATVALLKTIAQGKYSIEDLKNKKTQNEVLFETLDKNPELTEKIKTKLPQMYNGLKMFMSKNNLISRLQAKKQNGVVSEGDVYKELNRLDKSGQLDETQKQLLKYYESIEETAKVNNNPNYAKRIFSENASNSSLIAKAALSGKTVEQYIESRLSTKDGKPLTGEALGNALSDLISDANGDKDITTLVALDNTLRNMGLSKKEIAHIYKKNNVDWDEYTHMANAKNDGHSVARTADLAAKYGDKDQIEKVDAAMRVSAHYLDNEQTSACLTNMQTNLFDNTMAFGINKYKTKEDAVKIHSLFVVSENVSSERKSNFTKSMVTTTDDASRQLYYGQEFSKIKDAAVTEGLAAAEQYVDASVRTQYSQHVDNAIKNNGYSSDEINNINTARETGQTSYERNASSTDSTNSSSKTSQSTTNPINNSPSSTSKTSTASSSGGSAQTKPSASSASSTKVNISPANSNTVSQMKAQLAQLQYEHSIALRDKALDGLQNIIDKIQTDQEVRAQKQAELAQKEAKTDEEIAQAIKEAEAKSAEEQKQAQEQITKETMAELEQQEKLEKKYHISAETIELLRNAQRQGDLSTIYTKLGEINANAQKHFVQYLSRKDTATIIGFIRNQSSNKALIKELCRLNPGLIKSLDAQMLLDCGIEKADIIKYSDSHQLSILMYDLAKTGNTRVLNQFYDALGDDAQQVSSMPSKPVPGSDEWMMANMPVKVSMRHVIAKNVPRKFWV